MADSGWRRRLVVAGGLVFSASLTLVAAAHSFAALLAGFSLFGIASGAFVGLSQATLMDRGPRRREQNMARWTLAGSIGSVGGPVLVAAAAALAIPWQPIWLGFAALALPLVFLSSRGLHAVRPSPSDSEALPEQEEQQALRTVVRETLGRLASGDVIRWILLLAASDITLDVLSSFLAVYFVDVVKVDAEQAALAVSVWTLCGLAGNVLVVPLLEKVDGLAQVRTGAAVSLIVLPAFLLLPGFVLKLTALGLLALLNAGRYAVLQAKLYDAFPGRSGSVLAASDASALVAAVFPAALGFFARSIGLATAMWLLLVGPVAVIVGLPRRVTGARRPQP